MAVITNFKIKPNSEKIKECFFFSTIKECFKQFSGQYMNFYIKTCNIFFLNNLKTCNLKYNFHQKNERIDK